MRKPAVSLDFSRYSAKRLTKGGSSLFPLTRAIRVVNPRESKKDKPMNLFSQIRELVIDNLHAMLSEGSLPRGLSFDNVAVEPPRDAAHGDMATNAAMVLAKPAQMKPRDIAELLVQNLSQWTRGLNPLRLRAPGLSTCVCLKPCGGIW